MYLGPNLKKYENNIRSVIYEYARSNYHTPPLLEEISVEWFGEVYKVENIENELHEDLIIDFKNKGILNDIKSKYDRFVILPDVWSNGVIPNTGPFYPRNEYDMDRPNIVFVNGKVMELFCIGKDIYQYNHNRKTYTFYKSSECSELFENDMPNLKVLYIYQGSHVNNVKGNEDLWDSTSSDSDFRFCFNLDNIITENDDENRVGIALHHPHIIFDYDKTVDDRSEPIIHGLISTSNDSWLTPKWYNILENNIFVHNESVIFTNTFIVIYKDGTYNIENTYTKDKDKYVEKIDKHTIRIDKNDNISKIIVFLTEMSLSYKPVDSLYYKATKENPNACLTLSKYKKYTNDLLSYMNENMCVSVDKLIDWGYKYDRDVLVAIQNYFSCICKINPNTEITYGINWRGYTYLKPKIIIEVNNKLNWYPALFINNLLFCADYKVITNLDYSAIIIDPEIFFKVVDRRGELEEYTPNTFSMNIPKSGELPPYTPPTDIKDKWQDIDYIRDQFRNIVNDIKVIFVPYRAISTNPISRQSGRMFRNHIYKGELLTDLAGYSETNIYCGSLFVNGFLTTENNRTKNILRWFDDINLYGIGELNFNVVDSDNPSELDVYQSDKDYITSNNMQLLINRVDEKVLGTNRLYLGNISEHVINYNGSDLPRTIGAIPFKDGFTIAFDKYGVECTDNIEVLSKEYVNFDYMYNYVVGNGLEENMTITFNTFTLVDPWMEFDLEIDESRVDKNFNKGSYNENAILDINVRALFNPNEPDAVKPIPVNLKSNKLLLGQKIMTRYWLAYRGKNNPDMSSELSVLNGKLVTPDGKLGSGTEYLTDFISSDAVRGDRRLIDIFGSSDMLTDILTNAGVTYIDYESVVDSKERYEISVPDKYSSINTIDVGSWCVELHTKIKEEG